MQPRRCCRKLIWLAVDRELGDAVLQTFELNWLRGNQNSNTETHTEWTAEAPRSNCGKALAAFDDSESPNAASRYPYRVARQNGYIRGSIPWRVLETLLPANNQENASM